LHQPTTGMVARSKFSWFVGGRQTLKRLKLGTKNQTYRNVHQQEWI
jgi:hypothetical protein